MTKPPTPHRTWPLKRADLRGLLRLGVDATVGLTELVEAMHHTIASGTGIIGKAPDGRTRGITGLAYRAVRGGTRWVGHGSDAVLRVFTRASHTAATTPERDALLAVLNGVWGDHLAATGNPLAIPMTLRMDAQALTLTREALAARLPRASGKLIVLVHGLCMNDRQWARQGHDHGQALAAELGATAIYLHYNSGRHVSQNGRDFAALLEQAVQAWPVPVTELLIVGHSAGGLVARSACQVAQATGQTWLSRLGAMVFLGTPHHGAPLERGGHLVDMLFGLSPYVAPFARLGQARSAGITDLRFGNLRDADWQGRARHAQKRDDRRPTPLPDGVDAYLVAATMAERASGLRSSWVGDGLVPLGSALGMHRNPRLALGAVPETHRLVVTETNHWDLLNSAKVFAQLKAWLA